MNRFISFVIAALLTVAGVSAKYMVYNVKGNVRVVHNGTNIEAKKGMEVLATDDLIIERGSSVEILNSATSKIFTSTQPGRFSVTRVMIDAQKQADDNMRSIHDKINVGTAARKKSNGFSTSGHVMRTVETYRRPDTLSVDDMASIIIANIKGNYPAANCPIKVTYSTSAEGGLRYEVLNEFTDTIYFNAVKIKRGGNDMFDISELSQPGSCYIVAPAQALAREQAWGMDPAEETMVILSNYPFEVEEVIARIRQQMETPRDVPSAIQLPSVYVKLLN